MPYIPTYNQESSVKEADIYRLGKIFWIVGNVNDEGKVWWPHLVYRDSKRVNGRITTTRILEAHKNGKILVVGLGVERKIVTLTQLEVIVFKFLYGERVYYIRVDENTSMGASIVVTHFRNGAIENPPFWWVG